MSEFTMGARLTMTNNFSQPLSAATASAEKFKQTLEGTDGAVDSLGKSVSGLSGGLNQVQPTKISQLATEASKAATAAESVVRPMDGIVQSTNRVQNAIQSFNRGWQSVKQLPSTLHNIGSTIKNNVANGFTSARLQASLFVATLKTAGKVKLTNVVNSIKQFKATITEGKTGLQGFGNALKNIGKISIATTVNGIKNLVNKAKEFAKVNISGVVNKFKNLTSSFKSGASGSNTLHTALKKVASVSMNAIHSGIAKIGSLAKSAGSAVTSGLGKALSGIGKAAVTSIKAATTAVAAGAAAVGAVVAKSVTAYADNEQLVGGVETLFGAGGKSVEEYATSVGKSVTAVEKEYGSLMAAQSTVLSNADNAYKTAGLSSNAYMETVTSFSASLISSLGGDTEKAASFADKAIVAMADNANKMGTDMESIQNAYQGFAKQNYTMLDNLKLGFGGTKEEMQRLLAEAGKISGKKFDISSFADITEAIQVMQDKMGITGTTYDEAEKTISGSLASMKAAWSNTLVSLVSGGDSFDKSVSALVTTVGTFAKNILPAVTGALKGVGALIEDLAPIISQELPGLISSVLPSLISAATSIVQGLANALPSVLTTLVPGLLDGVTQIIGSLINILSTNGPQIITTLVNSFSQAAISLIGMLPQFISVGIKLIGSLVQGIVNNLPSILQAATQAIMQLAQGMKTMLPQLLQTGWQLMASLVQGIMNALPSLLQAAIQCLISYVQVYMDNLPMILQSAVQMIMTLVNGLVSMLPMLIQAAIQLIISLVQGLIQNLPMIIQSAVQIVVALAGGLIQAIPQLIAAIPQLISAIIDTIMNTNWLQVGWDIVKGIGKGLLDGIKGIFGGGGKEGGEAVATGAASGITSNMGAVTSATSQVSTAMTTGLQPDAIALNASGATAMQSMAGGITANAGLVYDSAAAIGPGIGTSLNTGLATVDTTTTATTLGTNVTTGFTTGIQTGTANVVGAATDMSTQATTAINDGMAGMSTAVGALDITGFETSCDGLINATTECMHMCNQTVKAGVDTITATVASVDLYSSGVSIMQGLNNGMQSMASSIMATAQRIANSVKTTINSALEIHSPSRVLDDSGEYAGLGFVNGLLSMVEKVKSSARTLADTAVEPFTAVGKSEKIDPSGVTTDTRHSSGGLRVAIERLILNDVGNKDPKLLVTEILNELYAQMGGADDVLSTVDMGVLL